MYIFFVTGCIEYFHRIFIFIGGQFCNLAASSGERIQEQSLTCHVTFSRVLIGN